MSFHSSSDALIEKPENILFAEGRQPRSLAETGLKELSCKTIMSDNAVN